jgi:hypothetical protein
MQAMQTMIASEKPDFVVLGGDTISNDAPGPMPKPPKWVETYWAKAVSPMIQAGVPWSVVIGNHDLGTTLSAPQVASLDYSFNGSHTISSNDVNYVLKVMDPSGVVPITNLFFFNSQAYGCLGVDSGSGCPTIGSVEWFRQTSDNLTLVQRGIVPGMAFLHIPPPEMITVYNNGGWYGNYLDSDGVCCSAGNTGLIANMMDKDNVKVVTFGHDHGNDFFGEYAEDLSLAYGRKTGYGSYNVPGMNQGSRVYLLQIGTTSADPDKSRTIYSGETSTGTFLQIDTWLRLADGQVLRQTGGLPLLRLGNCCHW